MIQLIIGEKGSGKTKSMIDLINESARKAEGHVICIEKSMKLTYSISHDVRVVDVDDYCISGYEMFYGFICGVLAGDYDISEMYIDGILKIGVKDREGLGMLLHKLDEITRDIKVIITVSDSRDALPQSVLDFPTVTHE